MKQLTVLYAIAMAIFMLAAPSCCTETRYVVPNDGQLRAPEEQSSAAVGILSLCPDGTGGMGSGVVIADRTVLTAAHVVLPCSLEEGSKTYVKTLDGTLTARVVAIAIDGDIARLEVASPLPRTPARLGPRPEIEDRVCLASVIPSRTRRCGIVDQYDSPPGDVIHDAITEPGNSGSGVYDRKGRLIGIVTHLRRCSNGQFCGGAFTSLEGRSWVIR